VSSAIKLGLVSGSPGLSITTYIRNNAGPTEIIEGHHIRYDVWWNSQRSLISKVYDCLCRKLKGK
jgi:hypothetical protein